MHGGAFAFGDIDMPEAHWVSEQLAARGIAVVSVSYQLAPGFDRWDPPPPPQGPGVHFPVASDEIVAAFKWAITDAAELGIDPRLLSIGGASAGANLTAGASLRIRDSGGAQPRSVLLVYPTFHAALPEPSAELAAALEGVAPKRRFPPESVLRMTLNYVRDEDVLDNAYAFQGGQDLAGLPPTFILNSEFDSLRSSGEAYAGELATSGVDVAVLREIGTHHGHLNRPDTPAAIRSIERIAAWLAPSPLVGSQHPGISS